MDSSVVSHFRRQGVSIPCLSRWVNSPTFLIITKEEEKVPTNSSRLQKNIFLATGSLSKQRGGVSSSQANELDDHKKRNLGVYTSSPSFPIEWAQ